MKKQITKITPEQAAKFSEWAEEWIAIGLSTKPADFDKASQAALKAYELCNLNRPKVILRMGSPLAATVGGALVAWSLLKQVEEEATLEHLRPHDTQEAIKFPPGTYRVRRQREYTPEGWRRVED